MRKLFLTTITILVLSFNMVGQATPNYLVSASKYELACGDVIQAGTSVSIDTLVISCFQTLLLQDNATFRVGTVVWDKGPNATWTDEVVRFMYGDIGWPEGGPDPTKTIVEIPREDMDGNTYIDYRYDTDTDPEVIWETCMPTGIIGDPNVTMTYYELCPDITLGDEEYVLSPENEMLLECVIWNVNGIEMHRGKFSEIFNGDCGVGCLDYKFWNKLLLIEFRTPEGIRIRVKRIYVR